MERRGLGSYEGTLGLIVWRWENKLEASLFGGIALIVHGRRSDYGVLHLVSGST